MASLRGHRGHRLTPSFIFTRRLHGEGAIFDLHPLIQEGLVLRREVWRHSTSTTIDELSTVRPITVVRCLGRGMIGSTPTGHLNGAREVFFLTELLGDIRLRRRN